MIDISLKGIGDLFTSAREALTGEKIVDPTKLAEIAKDLQVLENALMTGQMEINKAEAKHSSIFVAGWRPFVGWIGAAALAYMAILEPLARFAAVVWFGYAGPFPVLDTTITMQVLLGMLGIGSMRSFDKMKGVDTKGVK